MNGINRLDIKQLRVLNALLDLKNLSQVARKMGLTQQAISEQLRSCAIYLMIVCLFVKVIAW